MSHTLADKLIRMSLMSFPRPLNVTQFYPALSTYAIGRRFELDEFVRALDCYVTGNPLFSSYYLIERTFENASDFPVDSFQEIVMAEYENYVHGFLVMLVRYASDPGQMGIFTVFPMSMQDGFRCFRFHHALMESLKSGRDRFEVAGTIAEEGLKLSDVEEYLQPRKESISPEEGVWRMPWALRETTVPSRKAASLLEEVKREFVSRESENLLVMRNGSYQSKVLFGNHLLFLFVPRDVMMSGDGGFINGKIREMADGERAVVQKLSRRQDFSEAGAGWLPRIAAHPRRFGLNNYGNVTGYDGSDYKPELGRLIKYQWHMPYFVSGGAASPGSGMYMTFSLNGAAHDFLTVAR